MLLQRPSEPRQFYYDAKFERLSANAEGISRLLSMAPDIAVMEPTGVNYARLWGFGTSWHGSEAGWSYPTPYLPRRALGVTRQG